MRAAPFLRLSSSLAGAVILLDGAAKVASRALLPTDGFRVLPGLILKTTENTRGPFGLGPLWFAVLASLCVLGFARWEMVRLGSPDGSRFRLGLGLFLGGGLANLGERVVFGRTTDLLVIGATTALNLADLAIMAGLLSLLIQRRKSSAAARGFLSAR